MKRVTFFIVVGLLQGGCAVAHSMRDPYGNQVKEEFAKQQPGREEILTDGDIAHLPKTVQRYFGYVGAIGKPKIQNFRAAFDVEIKKRPDSTPMKGITEQYSFTRNPARIFYMKVRMFGIPADGLHSYRDQRASMVIRVASLFNVVDVSGPVLDETETVTLFNDMCLMAPATLIDPRVTFQEIDDTKTAATFRNGRLQISAILHFGKDGELVNFTSEDRSALQDDGGFKKLKFSTPVTSYKEMDGRRIFGSGFAVFHYPEGDFAYGKFSTKEIRYNVGRFIEAE